MQLNSIIAGKYRIECLLGTGGMGQVYLAYDQVLDRPVAIKRIRAEFVDASTHTRLRREAQILAKLNHPNIVQVHDFIDGEHGLAIVMEYVSGQTLNEIVRLSQHGLDEMISYLRQMTEALLFAHSNGIIHRDLKLDNIMLSQTGVIKIADFGIALLTDESGRRVEDNLGSYSALSPEQARGEALDQKTDYFALGIIIYKLITGRHPFGDTSAGQGFITKLIDNDFIPFSQAEQASYPELSRLASKLLQKNKQDRPASLDEVLQVLNGILPEASSPPEIINDDTIALIPQNQSNQIDQHSSSSIDINVPYSRVISARQWLASGLGLLAIALVVALSLSFTQVKQAEVYVAVLPPEFDQGSVIDDLHKQHIEQVLGASLEDELIQAKHIHLIGIRDTSKMDGDYRKIAKAYAADWVIRTALKCQGSFCDVVLEQLVPDSAESRGGASAASIAGADIKWRIEASEFWRIKTMPMSRWRLSVG